MLSSSSDGRPKWQTIVGFGLFLVGVKLQLDWDSASFGTDKHETIADFLRPSVNCPLMCSELTAVSYIRIKIPNQNNFSFEYL